MANQENTRIEQIDNELKRLGPEISKGKAISGVAVCGGIALVSFVLFLYFLLYYLALSKFISQSDPEFRILTTFLFWFLFCLILFIVMSIVTIANISNLRTTVEHNRKIEALIKERNSIQSQKIEEEQKETNDDTLLRLLSEGKITIEEYKKLSNNK